MIKECIHIDQNLHIQPKCNGSPILLPQWFIHGHNAKLTRFSMLENSPNYIKNVMEEQLYSILKELQKKTTLPTKRSSFIFCRTNISCLSVVLFVSISIQITSGEISFTIFFFIRENAKKLLKRFQCKMCSLVMVGNDSDDATDKYFDLHFCSSI